KNRLGRASGENCEAWTNETLSQAERVQVKQLRAGTGKADKLPPMDPTSGEYLASGFAGLEKLYRDSPENFWLLLRAATGAVVGGNANEEDPVLGAVSGALLGGFAPKLIRSA